MGTIDDLRERTRGQIFTEGDEGYDVNDVADWVYAEYMLSSGEASLPPISRSPFPVDA